MKRIICLVLGTAAAITMSACCLTSSSPGIPVASADSDLSSVPPSITETADWPVVHAEFSGAVDVEKDEDVYPDSSLSKFNASAEQISLHSATPQEAQLAEESTANLRQVSGSPLNTVVVDENNATSVVIPDNTLTSPVEQSESDAMPIVSDAESAVDETTQSEAVLAVQELPNEIVSADISAAENAANAYAANMYGVSVDNSLDMQNSSYRYPGCTHISASQDTLEGKCHEIVDFTFKQVMQQSGISLEQLQNADIRCRVNIVQDGDTLFCYCLFA